ncbi:MAG: sulfite exporter TauE/SafE family protein [Hyphomicrobiaceae bacterium]
MTVYLPIAGMAVNLFVITGVGFAVGFLSGMLGVGGGFLITPLLAVIGIPIDIAVATGANHAVATSASGAFAQWQRGNVDPKMALLMLFGGVFGSVLGVQLLAFLKQVGQMDFAISVCYVALLGVLGVLMLIEGTRTILRSRRGQQPTSRRNRHSWIHSLPVKTRFPRSKLYMSVIPPVALGGAVGLLSAIMGVGGGFFAVPVMVYLLGMPTRVVVGTSLLLVLATGAMTTVFHAWQNYSVDIVLALMLMVGGVAGAQLGTQAGSNLKGEQIRTLLGLLVLAVSLRIAWSLIATPSDLYSFTVPRLR